MSDIAQPLLQTTKHILKHAPTTGLKHASLTASMNTTSENRFDMVFLSIFDTVDDMLAYATNDVHLEYVSADSSSNWKVLSKKIAKISAFIGFKKSADLMLKTCWLLLRKLITWLSTALPELPPNIEIALNRTDQRA